MNSALQKIIESKQALRRQLAQVPLAEKLRILDVMRQRQVTISESGAVQRSR